MSTSGRPSSADDASSASDVAGLLSGAEFVRLLARADGDCLAAAGLLARACAQRGVPYQVRVGRFGETLADPESDENPATEERDATDRDAEEGDATGRDADEGDTTVGVGLDPTADAHLPSETTPASATAYDAARELDGSPDPVLALAGVVAAGHPPGGSESAHVLEAARARGLERRPGVGVPTDDLADGLAHSTLAHAEYSGDPEAAQAALAELGLPAELDASAHRRVASEFALAVAGAESATDRAAETVERALRPHAVAGSDGADEVDAPFATVEGYADVLEAVARERPGAGVALALGHDARADALDAWRDHAAQAHAALREGTTGRYDGLFVVRIDEAPVETVARLLRDFRSPEPVALVVSETEAAATATEDREIGVAMAETAAEIGGTGGGTSRRGYARFDPETDAKEFLTAFREARR